MDEENNAPAGGESEHIADGAITDEGEKGSATPEEIEKALGGKYKTMSKVADKDDKPVDEEEPEEEELEQPEKPEPKSKKEEPAKTAEPKPTTKPEAENPITDAVADKYAFTVEDANGVTFKITPDADIEDILKEFEPKNNGQIIKVLDQLREAKDKAASDQAEAEAAQAEAEKIERITSIKEGWKTEQQELQTAKRIPEGKDGDARIDEVMKFLRHENDKRAESGKPLLATFEDALDKLEAKEARDAKVQAEKDAKDLSRKNGALVGGGSAPASSGAPVYKAGSAKNAKQALRSMGVL